MCDPVTAIAATSAAISIGQQVLSYQGQQTAYSQNVKAAYSNYAYQTQQIGEQKSELDQKLSERRFDAAITQAQAEGKVVNSASASGLGPSSLVHALNTTDFGLSREQTVQDINDRNARNQLLNEQQGARIDFRN